MADPTTVSNNQTSFEADTDPDYTVWTDEVTDGGVAQKKQLVGLVDATANGIERAAVTAANGLEVDVTRVSGTVTVDVTELPAAAALGDTDANPTTTQIGSMLQGWTGSVWARLKAGIGDGAGATGFLNIVPMMFNGTTYDRIRGSAAGGLFVRETRGTAGAAVATFTSTTSASLLAANTSRIAATITNDSDKDLFVNLSTNAVTTSSYYVHVRAAGGFLAIDDYTGQITGIMASAIGSGQVTVGEVT